VHGSRGHDGLSREAHCGVSYVMVALCTRCGVLYVSLRLTASGCCCGNVFRPSKPRMCFNPWGLNQHTRCPSFKLGGAAVLQSMCQGHPGGWGMPADEKSVGAFVAVFTFALVCAPLLL
jgi:hypothetical protein